MNFKLGSVVRFYGKLQREGKPNDPAHVTATLILPSGDFKRYPLGEGLVRKSSGIYYVEIPVVKLGPFTVRFDCSDGSFAEARYQATLTGEDDVIANQRTPSPLYAAEEMRTDRDVAIQRLRAAGVDVQDSWSDNRINGAASALAETPREAYLRRQRGG
jgi:hypothetical protein